MHSGIKIIHLVEVAMVSNVSREFIMATAVIINRVFCWKTLVIKMMNVGARLGGWPGRRQHLVSKNNSATVRNILMVLVRIIEKVNVDCRCKNDNSAQLGFLITSPYPCFFLVPGLYLSNHLKYFNDTL